MKEGASTLQMEEPKLRKFKEKWFFFFFAGRPDPPFDVTFVNHTHSSITLSWKPGFDGGSKQWFRVRNHGNISRSITNIATRPFQLRISMVKSGLGRGEVDPVKLCRFYFDYVTLQFSFGVNRPY